VSLDLSAGRHRRCVDRAKAVTGVDYIRHAARAFTPVMIRMRRGCRIVAGILRPPIHVSICTARLDR
jgi:hypothetical protein